MRSEIPPALLDTRVVAIVRDRSGAHVRAACEALLEEGLAVLEITTSTPGAADTIAALVRAGATGIGMGTVRTPAHVRAAAEAGASFIVTPSLSIEVGEAALRAGLCWFPGAATPTEIETAWQAGATAVKVFPAGSLGGVGFVRDVRAPLDDIPLIPTGGVRIDDVEPYLAAGALALGMGSPLLGDSTSSGDLVGLKARARAVRAAVAEATPVWGAVR